MARFYLIYPLLYKHFVRYVNDYHYQRVYHGIYHVQEVNHHFSSPINQLYQIIMCMTLTMLIHLVQQDYHYKKGSSTSHHFPGIPSANQTWQLNILGL